MISGAFSYVAGETRVIAGGAVLLVALGFQCARGQVVLDGKFGTSGPVAGPNYNITAGMGGIRGNNLFHSFTQFDLKAGDIATFSGPANIQNILSRVTGGNPSTIDGTIRSSISGANMFFINPSGVLFGPNAAVDVSGSFAVSTANYLKLASGARFVASLDADDSMLTTGPVVAFGFLDGANGNIQVGGALKAGSGTSISVVGSTVSAVDGAHLETPGGEIKLAGVTAPGEVAFSSSSSAVNGGASLAGGFHRSGAGSANSGDIVIRGGRLVVDNATISASTSGGDINIDVTKGVEVVNGGQITTASSGAIKGGNIVVNAPSVVVDGQDGSAPTRIAAETSSEDVQGSGGDIIVQAGLVQVRRGAEISVSSFGAADAGRVEITANSLQLQGSDFPQNPTQIAANAAPGFGGTVGAGGEIDINVQSALISNGAAIQASTTGDANAGLIDINAGTLNLKNGAITTFSAGAGNGGEIRVQSGKITIDGPFASIQAVTTGFNDQLPAGNGGVITIKAGSLYVFNDAAISASTYGDGSGGNINITADSVVLNRATFQPGSIPGITAASKPSFFGEGGGGRGGDISIKTDSLTLSQDMTISATTSTSGDGGSITIQAQSISLNSGASIQSASASTGRAGTLSVQSSQNVFLTEDSTISTSAPQSSGGNLSVGAGGEIQLVNSSITAQAGPGGGGNITLTAPSMIYLLNSPLTAQAAGDGGNLNIDGPVFFIMNNGALISKSSSANGGNITILSDYFFQSSSVIDASAPFGLPGTVSVSAPNVDLSGSLVGLPSNLLDVETQLRPDCGVRLSGNISSFIVVGRGGLPLEPGGFVPSATVPTPDEKK